MSRPTAPDPSPPAPPSQDPPAGLRASAPGKVMLAGEYAVLEGADAVVMAVSRRVEAYVAATPSLRPGPFLRAVRQTVIRHAGPDTAEARAAVHMIADSTRLRAGRAKLGLGSSAAVTAAACACAMAHGPAHGPSIPLDLVHRLAHEAHGRAQARRGARGSGADIAACVYGGIVAARMRPDAAEPVLVRPLGTGRAHLVFLWTGASASTPALVSRVQAWRRTSPADYDRALAPIADAASQVIAALRPSARPDELVAAIEAGGHAIAELGRRAGVELETQIHRDIAALARACGQGAAKPTGAGGGDIALAAFATAAQADGFRQEAAARRMYVLDLAIDPQGVAVSSPYDPAAGLTTGPTPAPPVTL